jgi:fibro-slime domain-containing protein
MRALLVLRWLIPVLGFLLGCGARSELPVCDRGETRPCESICGPGVQLCVQGQWEACNAPVPEGTIPIQTTIRDFRIDHPDFESDQIGIDLGIVGETLGADGKPVYAGAPTTPTTSGKESFDQWFRDVPGINQSTALTVELTAAAEDSSVYSFDAPEFFPIDGQLFGNEGNAHNYHFTLEMQVDFRYVGGETFTFRGDDDVFAFINGRLAIDIGGVHSSETRTVDLDTIADAFGLAPGTVYPLALFFAERHTSGSSFHVTTTIAEFDVCPE